MNFSSLAWLSILHVLAALLERTTSQVFELDEFNFDQYTKDKDVMLVEFYAPWCHHCQALQPEWEKAGQALAANREFILGKVDCFGRGESLCKKHHVEMYPLIKLYRHGQFSADYSGERTAAAIINFMQTAQSQPANQPPPQTAPQAAPQVAPPVAPPPVPDSYGTDNTAQVQVPPAPLLASHLLFPDSRQSGAIGTASDDWAQGAAFQNTFTGNPQPFPSMMTNNAPPPPPPPPIPPPLPRLPPPPMPPTFIAPAAPVAPAFNGNWNPSGTHGMFGSPSAEASNLYNNAQGRLNSNQEFQNNLQNGNLWNPFLTDYWFITSPAARYLSQRNPLLPHLHNHFFQGNPSEGSFENQRYRSEPLRESMSASQIEFSGQVVKPFGIQSSSSSSSDEPSKAMLALPSQLSGSLGARLENQNGYKTNSFQYNNGNPAMDPFKFPEFKPKLESFGVKAFPEFRIKPVDNSLKQFPEIRRPDISLKPYDFKPLARYGNGNFRSNLRNEEPVHPQLERLSHSSGISGFTNTYRPQFQSQAPTWDWSAARTIDHYPVPGSSRQILHFDLGYRLKPSERVKLESHRNSVRKHFTFTPGLDLRTHQLINQKLRPEVLTSTSVQASRYDSQPVHQEKIPALNESAIHSKHQISAKEIHRHLLPKVSSLKRPVSPNPLVKFYQKPIPLRNLANSYASFRSSSIGPLVNLPQTDRALIRTKVSKPISTGRPALLRLMQTFPRPMDHTIRQDFRYSPRAGQGPQSLVKDKLRTAIDSHVTSPAGRNGPMSGSVRTPFLLSNRLPTWYRPKLPGIASRLPNTRTFEKTKPIPHYGDIWKLIYDFYNKKNIAFQKREFTRKFLSREPYFRAQPPYFLKPELRTQVRTRDPKLFEVSGASSQFKRNQGMAFPQKDKDNFKPSPLASHIVSPIWDKRQNIPQKANFKKNVIPESSVKHRNSWGLLRKRKRMIRKRSRTKRHFPFNANGTKVGYFGSLLRTKRLHGSAKNKQNNKEKGKRRLWF